MSDDSLPLENAHEHKYVFPFAMTEAEASYSPPSRRAVAGLARRRASAAWLTGHGRVQNVNKFFSSVSALLAREFTTRNFIIYSPRIDSVFKFEHITSIEIQKRLRILSIRNATGIDKISARMLKRASAHIHIPLVYIKNLSMETGVFPEDWMCQGDPTFQIWIQVRPEQLQADFRLAGRVEASREDRA